MAYGLGNRAPIARVSVEQDREHRPAERWQQLSAACRLALVERALTPGKLFPDGLPAAL